MMVKVVNIINKEGLVINAKNVRKRISLNQMFVQEQFTETHAMEELSNKIFYYNNVNPLSSS